MYCQAARWHRAARGLDHDRVIHRYPLQETAHVLRRIQRQSQHLHTVLALDMCETRQFGHFFNAGRAPAGPDIDQQRATASVLAQVQRPAFKIRQRQCGQAVADLQGGAAAATAGAPGTASGATGAGVNRWPAHRPRPAASTAVHSSAGRCHFIVRCAAALPPPPPGSAGSAARSAARRGRTPRTVARPRPCALPERGDLRVDIGVVAAHVHRVGALEQFLNSGRDSTARSLALQLTHQSAVMLTNTTRLSARRRSSNCGEY